MQHSKGKLNDTEEQIGSERCRIGSGIYNGGGRGVGARKFRYIIHV